MTAALQLPEASPYAAVKLEMNDAVDLVRGAIQSGVSSFDFDRVKVPAGGGTTWEIPSLSGDESAKELTGVIVGLASKKAYWKESMEDSGGGSPPSCRSEDGMMGVGDPGGSCARCPFNQFGSSEKGEGKACKDTTHILLIREGSILPVLLSVPPTSIRPVRSFLLRAAGQGIGKHAMEVSFTLERAQAGKGQTYSRIKPGLSRQLSEEEAGRFRLLTAELAPLLAAVPAHPEEDERPY
jgi:hypothetical protein